jgi:hypothetical protein
MQAANDDKKAHADGLPAVSKLRLLDRVMDTLQKCDLLYILLFT